ncbi:MAG TPA: HAD hydrolase-like protein, partial [Terriglobales bacterium]|nr:HAD hydrolase-like protein [Terriglobales bacterium]
FALRKCGLSESEVLFVGNQLNTDVCGGVSCGIRTVWISGEAHRSPDDIGADVKPDFVIKSMLELPDLMRHLSQLT